MHCCRLPAGLDLPRLNECMDFINIMTYDCEWWEGVGMPCNALTPAAPACRGILPALPAAPACRGILPALPACYAVPTAWLMPNCLTSSPLFGHPICSPRRLGPVGQLPHTLGGPSGGWAASCAGWPLFWLVGWHQMEGMGSWQAVVAGREAQAAKVCACSRACTF